MYIIYSYACTSVWRCKSDCLPLVLVLGDIISILIVQRTTGDVISQTITEFLEEISRGISKKVTLQYKCQDMNLILVINALQSHSLCVFLVINNLLHGSQRQVILLMLQ